MEQLTKRSLATGLLAVLTLALAGCAPSESDARYEVRGKDVVYIDYVTPEGMNGFGGIVYKQRERLIAADAKTFQVMPAHGYAKDARHVFLHGRMLEGSDAATFQFVGAGGSLARDKGQVYDGGAVIPGADPATYERVGNGIIGRDKNDYYFGAAPLHVADVRSFRVVLPDADGSVSSQLWGYDKRGFYIREEMTPIADGETFQPLGYHYAKDAKQVYFERGILADADAKTFQSAGGEFARDARRAYWHDFVLPGADPPSFTPLTFNYAKDAKQVYHLNEVIPDADASTFQVIGPSTKGFGYAKDARRVYYAASVIEGADPATFVVDKSDPERASDKNGRFQYGKRTAQ